MEVLIVRVNIKAYQDAYETALNKFKKNKYVIAVVVYGSMVSGDIWEESDIDFMVITHEKNKNDRVYSKLSGVPIHINYLSKDSENLGTICFLRERTPGIKTELFSILTDKVFSISAKFELETKSKEPSFIISVIKSKVLW